MGKVQSSTSKLCPEVRVGPRPRTNSRGEKTWQVRFRIDGRQSSKTFDSLEIADEFDQWVVRYGPARALEMAALDAAPRPVKGPTVAEWAETYIGKLTASKDTIQKYGRYLANDIAPAPIGRVRIRDLSDADVSDWINAQAAAGSAPGTIENKHRFLSGALNGAVRAKLVETNVAQGAHIPRGIERPPVFLSTDEFDTVLTEIPDWYKLFIETFVESGCRWGEQTALMDTDVDLKASTIHIQRSWHHCQATDTVPGHYYLGPVKTDRSDRVIKIRRDHLERVLAAKVKGQPYLFTNTQGGPVRANTFNANTWYPALRRLKAAGVPEVRIPRIHDFRHTHASWLLGAGIPMVEVSRRLGHQSIATTDAIYSHCAPDHEDDIMAALDRTRGDAE